MIYDSVNPCAVSFAMSVDGVCCESVNAVVGYCEG